MIEASDHIKKKIRDFGRELNISKIGFAKAEKLGNEFTKFKEWITSGSHGTMDFLMRNPEKREDITLFLDNTKTVIVATFNYFTQNHNTQESGTGKIARYAWGDDYHDVALEKLKVLAAFLEYHFNAKTKSYVDTGAILEKAWAVRAGIGWQGKNSLILNKEDGSYFFLGVIITDLEIEPDNLYGDFCGSCNKCMVACPTKAIILPKVITPLKCIAYWTIEAKPDVKLPEEISKNLNGWLFGCDICQEVCPWNSKAHITKIENFFPRNNETALNLVQIENMSKDEFSERFRKTPIKRSKLEGIKRNARELK